MAVIDKVEKVILAATALICAVIIAIMFVSKPMNETSEEIFIPPDFETAAVDGTPEIADKNNFYNTLEIPLTSGNCKVSIDAVPELNENELEVYFTNSAENNVWLKLVIYNDAGNIIAESGILKNGEYVKAVTLSETVMAGEELKAKILTYEPDTYYSLGSARAILKVK